MLISIVLFAALALPLSAPAGTTATTPIKLTGVTGPGFTITVKKAGTKVTRLKPGKYTITVTDKSGALRRRRTGTSQLGSLRCW